MANPCKTLENKMLNVHELAALCARLLGNVGWLTVFWGRVIFVVLRFRFVAGNCDHEATQEDASARFNGQSRGMCFLLAKRWHNQMGVCHMFVGKMVGEN